MSACETPDYTEGPCHCAHHGPETSRRERYAAEIGARGIFNQWVVRKAADAAMAVADTERASDRSTIEAYKQAVDRQHAALTSLREELAATKRELDRARRDAAYHNQRADGVLKAAVKAQGTIDLLREELGNANTTLAEDKRHMDKLAERLADAERDRVVWRTRAYDWQAKAAAADVLRILEGEGA